MTTFNTLDHLQGFRTSLSISTSVNGIARLAILDIEVDDDEKGGFIGIKVLKNKSTLCHVALSIIDADGCVIEDAALPLLTKDLVTYRTELPIDHYLGCRLYVVAYDQVGNKCWREIVME